jgi:hemoglobin/transferrin/lactoferrin receptor protein
VTSDRGVARPPFELPNPVFVIGAERIRSGPLPRSLPEALAASPSVHAQETARGQGSPFIRGLTSRRNILLIDGIRINNSVFRAGPNQYTATVDPFSLGRVEVISGARSILYGSDALGGVIKLESHEAGTPGDSLLQDGAPGDSDSWVRGQMFGRFSTADQSSTLRLGGRGQEGLISYIGGVTFQDFGELQGGPHVGSMPETDFSQKAADLKLTATLSERDEISILLQRFEQRNAPRTHSTIFSKSYRGTTAGSDLRRDFDQSRQLIALQAVTRDRGFIDQARLSLSWHRQYENQSRLRSGDRRRRQGFTVETLGLFGELSTTLPATDLVLRAGFDAYHDFVDTFRTDVAADGSVTRRPRGAFADDAQSDLFGLYIQAELPLGERFILQAGLRYEYAHLNADDLDPDPTDQVTFRKLDRSYDGVVGSFSASVLVTESLKLIASASQGFRAPNLDDTTSFDDVRSSSLDTPAPDLDPEATLGLDFGFKFDDPAIGYLQAFYFVTLLEDFISRVPSGRVVGGLTEFQRDNVSDGIIEGVELNGELKIPVDLDLALYGDFAWTYGEIDTLVGGATRKEPLSRVNPTRARVGLRWRSEDQRFSAEADALFVRHQDRLAPNDKGDSQRIPRSGTPGYTILSVRGSAELRRGLRLSLALENLLDRDYRVHGSGQNGPGRSAIFGLEASF